eukprot:11125142-Lingulodinium_polyedra.AAC.1
MCAWVHACGRGPRAPVHGPGCGGGCRCVARPAPRGPAPPEAWGRRCRPHAAQAHMAVAHAIQSVGRGASPRHGRLDHPLG